jgi:hypothetical protein
MSTAVFHFKPMPKTFLETLDADYVSEYKESAEMSRSRRNVIFDKHCYDCKGFKTSRNGKCTTFSKYHMSLCSLTKGQSYEPVDCSLEKLKEFDGKETALIFNSRLTTNQQKNVQEAIDDLHKYPVATAIPSVVVASASSNVPAPLYVPALSNVVASSAAVSVAADPASSSSSAPSFSGKKRVQPTNTEEHIYDPNTNESHPVSQIYFEFEDMDTQIDANTYQKQHIWRKLSKNDNELVKKAYIEYLKGGLRYFRYKREASGTSSSFIIVRFDWFVQFRDEKSNYSKSWRYARRLRLNGIYCQEDISTGFKESISYMCNAGFGTFTSPLEDTTTFNSDIPCFQIRDLELKQSKKQVVGSFVGSSPSQSASQSAPSQSASSTASKASSKASTRQSATRQSASSKASSPYVLTNLKNTGMDMLHHKMEDFSILSIHQNPMVLGSTFSGQFEDIPLESLHAQQILSLIHTRLAPSYVNDLNYGDDTDCWFAKNPEQVKDWEVESITLNCKEALYDLYYASVKATKAKVRDESMIFEDVHDPCYDYIGDSRETWMFHGASEDAAKSILKNGFDPHFFRPNGLYGQGAYFSRYINYSLYHHYSTTALNGNKYILLCRVNVGDVDTGPNKLVTTGGLIGKRQLVEKLNPVYKTSYDSRIAFGGSTNVYASDVSWFGWFKGKKITEKQKPLNILLPHGNTNAALPYAMIKLRK